MLDFNKIVKILFKKQWNVIFKQDIYELIDPEKKKKYQSKVDKTIYSLRSKWCIIPLKSWVYIIPDDDDINLNKVDLIDKYYLKLLKKYIIFYLWSDYYISGKKALEIHMKNYALPEKIVIINRNINKKIVMWDFIIIFKTISWRDKWKKINLYSKFSKYSEIKAIDWIDFKISNLELSLVESAILSDIEESLDIVLLKKIIKKYKGVFKYDYFYEIWRYKYIMSFNRLKELSKLIDDQLYLIFLDIIKKNWWLFIWEWLRWF